MFLQWLWRLLVCCQYFFGYIASKISYIYVALIKQDSPEVHANAAEILSAVTRCAPPALAAKICSPRFVLFINFCVCERDCICVQ
jgi:hypothetical protein